MRTNFFYSDQDVKLMKDLLKSEESIAKIARTHHQRFGAPLTGFALKLYSIAKTMPKRVTSRRSPNTQVTLAVPAGTSFEGVAKKVRLYSDHFRIYF